jgi:hypothetical protein
MDEVKGITALLSFHFLLSRRTLLCLAEINPMDNEKSIAEINELIAKVDAALEPGCEIGARDKMTLKGLLKAANITKKTRFFPCKREDSAKIIHHFVKVKGVPQSKFSMNAQPNIFLLY